MHGVWGILLVAAFLIGTAENDTGYLCPADGTCAHRAGLYRDIECAVCQILTAEGVGGSGDGLHLCVSRHIAECFCQIMSTGDDAVLAYDDGSDGNLSFVISLSGLVKGALHVEFVFFQLFFCHAAKVVLSLEKRTNKRHINR